MRAAHVPRLPPSGASATRPSARAPCHCPPPATTLMTAHPAARRLFPGPASGSLSTRVRTFTPSLPAAACSPRLPAGKLLVLNFFLFVPVVNYAYWSLLWARRRATGQPPSRAAPLALERTPGFTHQRKVLQYSADWRDMELDGKHWRAQFGGSNGRAPRTGAYVFFSATTYAPVRLLLALGAVALFTVRIVRAAPLPPPLPPLPPPLPPPLHTYT